MALGEEVAHDQPEPEDGHRDADQRQDRDHGVGPAARRHGGDDADEDAETEPDDSGADAERECRRDARLDLRDDVQLAGVRPQRPVEERLHHRPVLVVERVVQPQLVADVLDVLLRRRAAGDAEGGIATRDLHEDQVGDETDRDQYEHRADQPPEDEGDQRSILTFARGSSASRRPSLKTFSDNTVSTIAMPGMIASHGAVAMRSWPSAISVPQDALGGCTPAPRKERPASVRMLFAMISAKKTRIEDATFGSSSVNITRSGFAPWAVAASTNSFSRSDRIWPRSGRPIYGIST